MPPRVLFVCLGNICRSPMAEAVFSHLAQEAGFECEVDSAGTGSWHVGDPADPRTLATLRTHGVPYHGRGRQVRREDFMEFDHVIAMDQANHRDLLRMAPPGTESKVSLLLEWDPKAPRTDVPDPYYGGPEGFEEVYRLVDAASRALLVALREEAAR